MRRVTTLRRATRKPPTRSLPVNTTNSDLIRHAKAHTAKALIAPERQKIYDAQGYDVAPSNPEAANAFLAREYNEFRSDQACEGAYCEGADRAGAAKNLRCAGLRRCAEQPGSRQRVPCP